MEIKGEVTQIIFKNEENGYAVVKLKLYFRDKINKDIKKYIDSNTITATCKYDNIPYLGEELIYNGELKETKYGLQFNANSYERVEKKTLDAICKYLSSEYFPGIGIQNAKKIYDTLGGNCLDEIRKDKKVLDSVEGLTKVQKDTIYENLKKNRKKEKDTLYFTNLGTTIALATKIVYTLDEYKIEEVKENPYLLIDLIEGIGFEKADAIAKNMGIKDDDNRRIYAYTKYILDKSCIENGHTYITKGYLYSQIKEKSTISEEDYLISLDALVKDGKIIIDCEKVYNSKYYIAEGEVATSIAIRAMTKNEEFTKKALINRLNKIKNEFTIEYTEKQEQAILSAFTEKILVVTGGPGTGKSTIVDGILKLHNKLYKNCYEQIKLLAPTGKAAKRLKDITNTNAQTIHSFLAYDGTNFNYDIKDEILDIKYIIVDEFSMVELLLAQKLFDAINDDATVILVGDVDQIPSIGAGNVLHDIIESKKIKTIVLDKIHRQAENSSIIRLAHEINKGNIPRDIFEKKHDRTFINLENDNQTLQNLVKVVKLAMSNNMSIQKDIQVLVPKYKGILGIININNILQNEINPLGEDKRQMQGTLYQYRINDKVIQLENLKEDGIMNGDIGVVVDIKVEKNVATEMTVEFDSGDKTYTKQDIEKLALAYVISIHKSQGSEFLTTIIPFSKSYNIMLNRRLYYTAITRAKNYLIMFGSFDAFQTAVNNNSFVRNSTLKELIINKVDTFNNSKNTLKNFEDNKY